MARYKYYGEGTGVERWSTSELDRGVGEGEVEGGG